MSEASINKVLKLLDYNGRLTGHDFRHTMSAIFHKHCFESTWIELQLPYVDKNSIRGNYNHAHYILHRKQKMQWHSKLINNLHLLHLFLYL